jgi:hypothetical protein
MRSPRCDKKEMRLFLLLLPLLIKSVMVLTVGVTVKETQGFTRPTIMSTTGKRRRQQQQQQDPQSLLPPTWQRRSKNDDNDISDGTWISSSSEDNNSQQGRRNFIINTVAAGLLAASGVASYSLFRTNVYTPTEFQRLPRTQFIAALGDPSASEGIIDTNNDGAWGIWSLDPGPRGVWLRDYTPSMKVAPAGWTFDESNWWLEEHGLIMESPYFPLPPGRYLVTGGRLVTTGLTITEDGRWKLDEGTLGEVTHLPCRSARYRPIKTKTLSSSDKDGTPLAANPRGFPVTPGAEMPPVPGTSKKDYAVLFVVGKAA